MLSSRKFTDHKSALLPLLLKSSALTFGSFTLKSGRQSPYFFNSSTLTSHALTHTLGPACSSVLSQPPFSLPAGTDSSDPAAADGSFTPAFEIVFGPAYKGIPLASLVVRDLPHNGKFDAISYSYNRKEAKAHGEGGTIGGASLSGKRVVIVDDVITAGTALREAVSIIKAQGGTVVGVVVLLSRQERVSDAEPRSAMKVAEDELGVPVRAVLTFQDLIDAIEAGKMEGVGKERLLEMEAYRDKYGSKD